LAEPEASAARAGVLPGESAAQAAAVLRWVEHAAAVPQAAARDVAEAPRQEEEAEVRVGAVVVPRPEAAAQAGVAEVARQPEARDAAGEEVAVLQRAARGVRAVLLRAALPSAVLLAFRRDQPPPWPAP
jgi:hypothetical protein